MLVLSRKQSELVVIRVPPSSETQEIKVLVTEICGDVALMGFDAPRAVTIHREEVQERIDQEQ